MTEQWSEILCIIIVATITIANLFAIRQNNLKRFMASVVFHKPAT